MPFWIPTLQQNERKPLQEATITEKRVKVLSVQIYPDVLVKGSGAKHIPSLFGKNLLYQILSVWRGIKLLEKRNDHKMSSHQSTTCCKHVHTCISNVIDLCLLRRRVFGMLRIDNPRQPACTLYHMCPLHTVAPDKIMRQKVAVTHWLTIIFLWIIERILYMILK